MALMAPGTCCVNRSGCPRLVGGVPLIGSPQDRRVPRDGEQRKGCQGGQVGKSGV